jgi:hypothetical protein
MESHVTSWVTKSFVDVMPKNWRCQTDIRNQFRRRWLKTGNSGTEPTAYCVVEQPLEGLVLASSPVMERHSVPKGILPTHKSAYGRYLGIWRRVRYAWIRIDTIDEITYITDIINNL